MTHSARGSWGALQTFASAFFLSLYIGFLLLLQKPLIIDRSQQREQGSERQRGP